LRDGLRVKVGWSTLGWLAPLVFLALPNCDLVFGLQAVPPSDQNLKPGDPPLSSAVFCDIRDPAEPHCATPGDIVNGVRADQAALLLLKDKGSPVVLDYSDAARNSLSCAAGVPVATYYLCDFPQGCPICINCGTIGTNHPDANAVCVAACEDRLLSGAHPADTPAFCAANAHTATSAHDCVDGVCSDDGGSRPDFVDPRRTPAAAVWTDLVGVQPTGTDLSGLLKTAVTTGFDAGAASVQTITAHNAYAEFTVTETDKARVLGLSAAVFPDASPGLDDIAFGIRLTATGTIVLQENGAIVTGPGGAPFGTYQSGDRLRITVTERPDGQADIGYVLIPVGCAGTACAGTALKPDPSGPAPYPFRVDASLKEPGATLTDVRIVRTF
jgi:hypothetical protein